MSAAEQQPIGELLRALRMASGRSQNDQADVLSGLVESTVTRSDVSRWERETRIPTPYWQKPMATSFRVPEADIRRAVAHSRSRKRLADSSSTVVTTTTTTRSEPAPDSLGMADLGMTPGEFLARTTVETPAPNRIGWSEVEHVRATTRAVAMSENLFGGGLSCEAAMAQLRWAGSLIEAQAQDDVRAALLETVGNLSSVVAFSAFDIANYEAADNCFKFSLWCADEGKSWSLRANALAEMARKETYLGDFDNALSLIEFAQVRADRLTGTARAMLWTLRARLLALTGRGAEARSDIERADAEFFQRDTAEDPPWLCYYDEAEHQGSTGKSLIPVAREQRDLEIAAPRLEKAVQLQDSHYPRSRTFSTIRLASLMMTVSDPEMAVPLGRQAMVSAASLRSQRIVTELHGLARAAEQHKRIGDVAELRRDIATLELPGS